MKRNFVLLASAAFLIIACKPAEPITGKEREAFLKSADAIANNVMTSFNANDYSAYSRDFNATMSKALDEKKFQETRKLITGKIGLYKSRVINTAVRKGKYEIAVYSAAFEKERDVQIRVVLEKAGNGYKLAGLWFNSPKLRGK